MCAEIDNPEDLAVVSSKLKEIESRTVYMCFSTDIIHGGHIAIIRKAQRLGRLIIGVLSDEAVASYKRMPLVPASERKVMFENIAGVYKVVEQKTLSYRDNLEMYRPSIVVHGDRSAMKLRQSLQPMVERWWSIRTVTMRSISKSMHEHVRIWPCRIFAGGDFGGCWMLRD